MVGRQNADIADTLHLRDVATATTTNDTLFDSRGGFSESSYPMKT